MKCYLELEMTNWLNFAMCFAKRVFLQPTRRGKSFLRLGVMDWVYACMPTSFRLLAVQSSPRNSVREPQIISSTPTKKELQHLSLRACNRSCFRVLFMRWAQRDILRREQ